MSGKLFQTSKRINYLYSLSGKKKEESGEGSFWWENLLVENAARSGKQYVKVKLLERYLE